MNTEQVGFSIGEWCNATRISQAMFFKQRRLGRGPKVAHIGRRAIVVESPREYFDRLGREAESAQPRALEAV